MRHFIQERTVSPPSVSHDCGEEGCSARTREGKPFCPDHIFRINRPRSIQDMLAMSEVEIAEVKKRGAEAVNLDGLIVEELLAGIAEAGEITFRRLVKDRVFLLTHENSDNATADSFLKRLKDEELVFVGSTNRGDNIVRLTPKGMKFRKGS